MEHFLFCCENALTVPFNDRMILQGRRKQMSKRLILFEVVSALLFWVTQAYAGADLRGTVPQVQLNGNGDLYFTVSDPSTSTYCLPGWAGLTMYIPKTDSNFPYYYGLLLTAVSKAKPVYIANISIYNGSTLCDITKTGYGVMLLQ